VLREQAEVRMDDRFVSRPAGGASPSQGATCSAQVEVRHILFCHQVPFRRGSHGDEQVIGRFGSDVHLFNFSHATRLSQADRLVHKAISSDVKLRSTLPMPLSTAQPAVRSQAAR